MSCCGASAATRGCARRWHERILQHGRLRRRAGRARLEPRGAAPGAPRAIAPPARGGNAMTRRQQRMFGVAVLAIGIGLAAALTLTAFRKNLMAFYTPTDLVAAAVPA